MMFTKRKMVTDKNNKSLLSFRHFNAAFGQLLEIHQHPWLFGT